MPALLWRPPKQAEARQVSSVPGVLGCQGRLTASSCRGVSHISAWYDGLVAANAQGERGQCRRAGEGIASLATVIGCTRDLRVVRRDDTVVHEKKGRTSIRDSIDGGGHECATTHGIAGPRELPKAVGIVHAVRLN